MNNNLFLISEQVRGSIKIFIDANPSVPEKQIREKIEQLTVQLAKINNIELTNIDKEEILEVSSCLKLGSFIYHKEI